MSRWIKFVEPNAKWVRLLIYSNFQRRPVVQNRNGGPLTVFNHGSGIVASSSKLWSQRHPLRISRPVVTLAESTLGNRQNKFSKPSRRNKKPAPAGASAGFKSRAPELVKHKWPRPRPRHFGRYFPRRSWKRLHIQNSQKTWPTDALCGLFSEAVTPDAAYSVG